MVVQEKGEKETHGRGQGKKKECNGRLFGPMHFLQDFLWVYATPRGEPVVETVLVKDRKGQLTIREENRGEKG